MKRIAGLRAELSAVEETHGANSVVTGSRADKIELLVSGKRLSRVARGELFPADVPRCPFIPKVCPEEKFLAVRKLIRRHFDWRGSSREDFTEFGLLGVATRLSSFPRFGNSEGIRRSVIAGGIRGTGFLSSDAVGFRVLVFLCLMCPGAGSI